MPNLGARCPVRLDLAGGTVDIWPLHLVLPAPGVTVNVALDVPVRVRVTVEPGRSEITLESRDQGISVTYPDAAALTADLSGPEPRLALLGMAVEALGAPGGLTLHTEADSPPGAGLGGSSALLCAVLGALDAACRNERSLADLQRLAQDVETRLLGTPTGYQDYFPPLYGGCLALEGAPGGIVVERLDLDLDDLAARLRLVYTGQPHHSGLTNWATVRAYLDGEPHTVDAVQHIAANAREVRSALRVGDLDAALAGVLADGRVRRTMAPGVSTPEIEAIDAAVRAAGARGTKILGAGGGGCVLVVLDPEDGAAVDAALRDGPGEPMPLRLSATGLEVRREDPPA